MDELLKGAGLIGILLGVGTFLWRIFISGPKLRRVRQLVKEEKREAEVVAADAQQKVDNAVRLATDRKASNDDKRKAALEAQKAADKLKDELLKRIS